MKLDSAPLVEATESDQSARKFTPLKQKAKRWLAAFLVLGILTGGGFAAYRQVTIAQRQEQRRRVQTVTVERVNLPVTLTANGTVQPEQSVNVSPKSSGVLKQLLVKEGDRVKAGQILAYMDDSNLRGELTQAQGQLRSAQANLQRLIAGNRPQDIATAEAALRAAEANLQRLVAGNRPQDIGQASAQVRNAQATLQQAQLTYSRNQQLYGSGAIARQDLDTARTSLESAQAQLAQAQQALSLQKAGSRSEDIAEARAQVEQARQALSLQRAGTRPEEIEQARAQVETAQGSVETTQSRIADTVIRAPFDGIVNRIYADPGSFVTPTTSGSEVSSATSSSILAIASRNQVMAKVAETSIPKIKLGQTVLIEADAYPGRTFQGKVTQVATQSVVEQNVTNFEVEMALNDPKTELRSGMNVNVNFQIGNLSNALVIPTVAIVRQEEGTGVFLAGGDNARSQFQKIQTGPTVGDKTVVESGLQEGDLVMLSFPQGGRPTSRTPSIFPGMGGGGGRRGGR
ncbi:MAG TPA: efflux RND transporter periplasmic adaptor subunit [Leptolyngbyaceae cyanobacterium M33_DOE_097]|uniref:Efflux RND transporter periplasmic adaptor subunit n=1 Tax=Oscillatoriales cyanobacterium SpSt-418 TaxID=2282169 RepID=A0A7C3PF06_9CYAN|nr:efflux RND transporter periplasmic adaptor subunit [Leptolyngbyaceae cyanobacterium M33_DOE_097]